MSHYTDILPITSPIAAERQSAKRHYGVHPYFTRRPHNVVRKYILNYSQEQDVVLDPFGGSGVTAIEAFLENRRGIQNDINPLANFVAEGIANLADGDVNIQQEALSLLQVQCQPRLTEIACCDESRLSQILAAVELPENVRLPSNSDVENYYDLFTCRQLASLAALKEEISKVRDARARDGMLLAWSATLSKINKTFLSAEGRAESRGGSSIFSIYRYKVAKEPVELPVWKTFHERASNVIEATAEIQRAIRLKANTKGWHGSFETRSQDVEELSKDLSESVDYIFTDPPYGGHISYLDLSTLWSNWLGFAPDLETRKKEIIVGGELKFTEQDYTEGLKKSVRACVRMLKRDRWLSIVFQHWSLKYFEAILSAAADEGAELMAAVSQAGDPIWSMHKKKNKGNVLAGELILTFYKSGHSGKCSDVQPFDIHETLQNLLSESKETKIYSEVIFNKFVISAWKCSALNSLNISRDDFIGMIESYGWRYDASDHSWVKAQHFEDSLFA